MIKKQVKGFIPPKKTPAAPKLSEEMSAVAALIGDLHNVRTQVIDTADQKMEQVSDFLDDAKKQVEDTSKVAKKVLEDFENTAIELISAIQNLPLIEGKPGKDADEVDQKKLVADVIKALPHLSPDFEQKILARIPKVDEAAIVKKLFNLLPKSVTELEDKAEKDDITPEDVIKTILGLAAKDFQLTTAHIKGLDAELAGLRHTVATRFGSDNKSNSKGYVHGGGDTIVAGTNITLTRNANGTVTINASGGGAVDSVFGRTGVITAQTGDYTAAQVTNAFDVSADTSDDIVEGTTNLFMSAAEQTKLGFITVTGAANLDQMQIDIAALANGLVYKGNWDASAGTFPGSGTAKTGWLYTVSVAGTVDGVVFNIGDSIAAITNNASTTTYSGNWSKFDSTDSVTSVFGRVGAVTAQAGDYDTSLVADTTNKRYVTDAQLIVIGNTSGTNTGDQTAATLPGLGTAATHADSEYVHMTGAETVAGEKTFSNLARFSDTIRVTGNGGSILAVGVDHTYHEYYPIGIAGGRKAYTGYAGAGVNDFRIQNEINNAHLILATTGTGQVQTTGAFVATGTVTGSNLSGTNTGDQTSIVGITGTKAQFDTAVTDGNFMYVGDEAATVTTINGRISAGTNVTITGTGTAADPYVVNSSGGGGGSPGGSTTQVQYNNAGAFGGITGATTDGTNLTLGSANLRATRPRFVTSIDDTNGNEIATVVATTSAVNQLQFTNAATGNAAEISTAGGDSSIGLTFDTKATAGIPGAMTFKVGGLTFLRSKSAIDTSEYTNSYLVVGPGSTSFTTPSSVTLAIEGTDTNMDMSFTPKGTGNLLAGSTFRPVTNDGAALGTTTYKWSDLFLASGAVINFNSGNATLTHSAGLLTSNVDIVVPDEVYGAGWNGSLEVPTKNAIYDKIQTMGGGGSPGGSSGQMQYNNAGAFDGMVLTYAHSGTNSVIATPNQTIADTVGESMSIELGNGKGTGSGGSLLFVAGDDEVVANYGASVSLGGGEPSGNGGSIGFYAGQGEINGGSMLFSAGNTTAVTGIGGNVVFQAGSGTAGNGAFGIQQPGTSNTAFITTNDITSSYNYALPDFGGTFAMMSNLTPFFNTSTGTTDDITEGVVKKFQKLGLINMLRLGAAF